MLILSESSYCVNIIYDAILDEICFETRYRFDTKELAEKFISVVEEKYNNIILFPIFYEKERMISGYTDEEPYRPKFFDLDLALLDLEQMMTYCNNYWFADKSSYKYYSTIFTLPIIDYDYPNALKTIRKLKEQNEQNEQKIKNIKKIINETNYSKNELEEIIEVCKNKIDNIIE